MMEKIHVGCIKILLFIVPLLPLYVTTSMYFPYISGKNFAFRVIIEFITVLWIVLIWLNSTYRPRNSKILYAVLVFTFIVGLADMFGVDPYNSFWSNFERMEGYITILHLVLYYLILKSVMKKGRDWFLLLNVIVLTGTIVSLSAMSSLGETIRAARYLWEYGSRVSGTLGNPPFLASYLLLVLFCSLILLTLTQNIFIRTCYLGTVLINLIAIYLTASRGAILALMIGMVLLGLYYMSGKPYKQMNKSMTRVVSESVFLLISVAIVVIFLVGREFISHDFVFWRFASILSSDSVETRLDTWQIALQGIKARPVLGWGQENFPSLYNVIPIPFSGNQVWVDRAHNILLHWAVNAGLLGLISYLAIFILSFYVLVGLTKRGTIHKSQAAIGIIFLIAYFIQNLFTFDTINTYLIFFALLAFIDSLDTKDTLDPSTYYDKPEKRRVVYIGAVVLALLSASLTAYYVNYKPMRQSQITKQSSVLPSEQYSSRNLLNNFRRALSYGTFGDTYVRRQMGIIATAMLGRKPFNREGASEFIQATSEELYKGIAKNQYNPMYLSGIISFYRKVSAYDSNLIDMTMDIIKAGLRLNPRNQWLYIDLSELYVQKGDIKAAYEVVEQITASDPTNDMLQVQLALNAIRVQRNDVARHAMKSIGNIRRYRDPAIAEGKKPVFSFKELNTIARAYRDVGDYEIARQYYNELLVREPRNVALHYELAHIYSRLGDAESARREAEIAAGLAPLESASGKMSAK